MKVLGALNTLLILSLFPQQTAASANTNYRANRRANVRVPVKQLFKQTYLLSKHKNNLSMLEVLNL
jgi:hypothetical protein